MTPTPMFPDTATLQTSDDGSEYIYGGSVGLNRILGYFRAQAFAPGRVDWPLYLINGYTVLRNVFDKRQAQTEPQLVAAFERDLELLFHYIEAYMAAQTMVPRLPTIVVYLPRYDAIPAELRRPVQPNTERAQQDAAYAALLRHLPGMATDITQTPHSRRFLVPVGPSGFPHKELARWVQHTLSALPSLPGQPPGYRYNTDPALLLSHCPVDLHLHRLLHPLALIESYQGVVKQAWEFGSKIVKEGTVPFNTYTHRVFGDPVHLKPLVQGRQRAALLAVAADKRWLLKPEAAILADITAATSLTAQELIRLKL